MDLQNQFDTNMCCEICTKYVRLVPILHTSELYDPQFTLERIIELTTENWKFYVCPMCCAAVCSTAKFCTEEFMGRYECFVCGDDGYAPMIYLDNYNNQLFRSKTEHIIYLRYIHLKCWNFNVRLQKIYNIIKGNDWSLIRYILDYENTAPGACAPIIFPITIPRPFGYIFKPKIEAPKLDIDIKRIEGLMKNIKP